MQNLDNNATFHPAICNFKTQPAHKTLDFISYTIYCRIYAHEISQLISLCIKQTDMQSARWNCSAHYSTAHKNDCSLCFIWFGLH